MITPQEFHEVCNLARLIGTPLYDGPSKGMRIDVKGVWDNHTGLTATSAYVDVTMAGGFRSVICAAAFNSGEASAVAFTNTKTDQNKIYTLGVSADIERWSAIIKLLNGEARK